MNQSFRLRALIDIYCPNCGATAFKDSRSLLEAEDRLARVTRTVNKRCSGIICSGDYNWTATLELTEECKPKFSVEMAKSCAITREFGSDRILVAKISAKAYRPLNETWPLFSLKYAGKCCYCKVRFPVETKVYRNPTARDGFQFSCSQCVGSCLPSSAVNLLQHGLSFGGHIFYFLGGEPLSSGKRSSDGSYGAATFRAWFISPGPVEEEVRTHLSHKSFVGDWGRHPLLSPVSNEEFVRDIRQWIGDFKDFPSGKLNARIKLAFSPTVPSNFLLPNKDIFVIGDVEAQPSSAGGSVGNPIMTDGCGFISDSLACKLLVGISSGKLVQWSKSLFHNGERPPWMTLPAVVQVRCIGSVGLYKGCLIVTNDIGLCPRGGVVFRKSMKKANGCNKIFGRTDVATLDICSTFERFATSRSSCSQLSRSSCLLLHFLGVPRSTLEELVKQDVERVKISAIDRSAAYSLVFRELRRDESFGDSSDQESDSSEPTSIDDMSDLLHLLNLSDQFDTICSSKASPAFSVEQNEYTQAQRLFQLLRARHPLTEPYVAQLIRNLQLKQLKSLQHCNIRVENCAYLVGIPDPIGVLEAGQVYIELYGEQRRKPRELESWASSSELDEVERNRVRGIGFRGRILDGDVLVYRNPLMHPGDIRKLTAVPHPSLAEFFEPSCGGVVVFSTQGIRSAADEMSGGDFDGDEYMVMYDMNEFVSWVTPVEPHYNGLAARETDELSASQIMSDKIQKQSAAAATLSEKTAVTVSCEIFCALLQKAQGQSLGRISYAWLAFADDRNFGPLHPCTLELHSDFLIEIDSAKTGKHANPNLELLKKLKPRFMVAPLVDSIENQRYDTQFGSIILDDLFEFVSSAIGTLRAEKTTVGGYDLDPQIDSRSCGIANWHDLFQDWTQRYRQYKSELSCILSDGRLSAADRRRAIGSVKHKYRQTFECDAENLYDAKYNRRFPSATELLQLSRCTATSERSADEHHCDGVATASPKPPVKTDILPVSSELQDGLTLLRNCRCYIAAIVYAAVYLEARESMRFSFCWEICGEEINEMKALHQRTVDEEKFLKDMTEELKQLYS